MSMKLILSPSRNMKECKIDIPGTMPAFQNEATILAKELKKYNPWDLADMLKINDKLAYKAFINVQNFDANKPGTPALFAYDGLVFRNLDPANLSASALSHSHNTLRIISAFYGLLRPLDMILPYRLELQNRFKINNENLYKFWDEKIYLELYRDSRCIINLASEEYAKVVRSHLKPGDRFIDIVFCSVVKGRKKVVTTRAKMARGQMAKYILENKINSPEALKGFQFDGFEYDQKSSHQSRFVYFQKII